MPSGCFDTDCCRFHNSVAWLPFAVDIAAAAFDIVVAAAVATKFADSLDPFDYLNYSLCMATGSFVSIAYEYCMDALAMLGCIVIVG